MFKKLIKNQQGSALVFVMILIANAILIVASIVLVSVIQEKASGNMRFAPAAYQKADSGLEYILKEINHTWTNPGDKIDDLCDSITARGSCEFNNLPGVSAYFFKSGNIMDSNDVIVEIEEIRVNGQVQEGNNRVSRSLRATLAAFP